MASRGRPPLTEDALQERLADYASRYGTHELNPEGFPVYPGNREGVQHRDWIALYKAWRRVRDRAAVQVPGPGCVVCGRADGELGRLRGRPGLAHSACSDLVSKVESLGGLRVLERLRRLIEKPAR